MKSTGTKRILSVLSAGALIASMSAIPVFAAAGAKAEVTEIAITGLADKEYYVNTGKTYNFSDFPTAGSVKMNVDKETENKCEAPATMAVTGLAAADWEITDSKGTTATASALGVGTYKVTLDKASSKIAGSMTNTTITYVTGGGSPAGDASSKVTVTVPSTVTIPSFTVTVKENVEIKLPAAGTKEVSIKAMTGSDALTTIEALDLGIAGLKTFTVDTISENADGATSPITSAALEADKIYYAACTATAALDGYSLPAPATFTLKVKVTAAGTVASTKSADYVLNSDTKFSAIDAHIKAEAAKIEGVDSVTSVAYKESKIAGVTVAAPDASGANANDVMKANDRVVGEVVVVAKPGYALSAANSGKITYTLNIKGQGSSSSDEDEDSGNASDTAPDFTEKDMTTSTVSGNTFTHPEADVLQNKLNSNKGTTISIGEVKSGTTSVASFAVTLPTKSGNISENTVAKVINVLNTISTKSASKNAQSAVDEVLKSADDKNTASMPISFSKSMSDFGMTVSVTVPVTSKFTNGGTTLYYYNPSEKKLEKQNSTVTIRGGKATFDLTHASEYFLIQGVKDLSAGEGANDSEDTLSSTEATTAATSKAPVVTAPEVTDPAPVETTVPSVATNPGTGNAPIALAVIPVAIAAAAIIAKKAK